MGGSRVTFWTGAANDDLELVAWDGSDRRRLATNILPAPSFGGGIDVWGGNDQYVASGVTSAGEKRILVRIIKPTSDAVRDGIIRATNSQTHIRKPYLRGMDRVHRNIEDFFRKHGLYYERRKNQYRNEEKPRSSIVTLTEMSQSLVAALLFRGGDARGRPTTLINDDKDYQALFSENYPLDTFLSIIRAKREIMNILASIDPPRGAGFRNNVVWHALAFVSGVYFHSTNHAASGWATLQIDAEWLPRAVAYVVARFDEEGGTDGVAKSPGFQETIAAAAASLRSAPIPEPAQPANPVVGTLF